MAAVCLNLCVEYFFVSSPAAVSSLSTICCTVLLLIRSRRSLKNKAFLELSLSVLIPSLGRTSKYSCIARTQALFKYIVLSLLPFPITVILFSEKSISLIFIPTNSDKRIPQFKNKVIIA